MKRNNEFSYSENNITIIFCELPKREFDKAPLFEFEVLDNTELDEKLKKTVRSKAVLIESIPYCAKALFAIIASGKFEEVAGKDRIRRVFDEFTTVTGEYPFFSIKTISITPLPRTSVKLLNESLAHAKIEVSARNTITAKVLALEQALELLRKK